MTTEQILLGLLFWPFTLLVINWLDMLDWDRILSWFVKIILPNKRSKGFEQNEELRKSSNYIREVKRHKRKWRIRFMLPIATYIGTYILLVFFLQKPLYAFFIAIWPSLIVSDRLAVKAKKERKDIMDLYKSKKTRNDSLS